MKRNISTENAPTAIGPYSQGVEVNGILFISGQLPINPTTGKMVEEDVAKQKEQSLKNVKAILEEAGYSFNDVVKTTVFLSDMQNFASMNEVYKKYYATDCPARSAFAVKALPMNALVEIETIAGK